MGDTNTFVPEGIYALANPSSGITALNMNGECNLFGKKTYFNMTSFETFAIIDDAPVEKEVVKEKTPWWDIGLKFIVGAVATAVLAVCAVAVVATGAAVLGGAVAMLAGATLMGAAVGTGIVTISATISDIASGQSRSWTQFLGDLITGAGMGAVAGATIYGLWTALPVVGQAAGIQVSMWLGGVSKFTAITIPKIFAGVGYVLIGTQGTRYLNELTSIGTGQNWILEHIFGGNQNDYTTASMCLDLLSMGYLQIARDNAGLAQPKITLADRKKLSKWTNPPDDDLYLQHKNVFDNRNYYNQKTGEPIWPGQNGNCHTDGFLNGIFDSDNLKPGKIIDRYGGNNGTFFGDEGTPIENRAMAPNSDFSSYNKYEVLKELPVRQGTIAPWFGQPGGGIQYQLEPKFVDSIRAILGPKKDLIDGLIDFGYLKRL